MQKCISKGLFFIILLVTSCIYSSYPGVNAADGSVYQDTCTVCFETRNHAEFYRLSCNHSFCKPCLTYTINTAIQKKSRVPLKCYEPDCTRKFMNVDLRLMSNFAPIGQLNSMLDELRRGKYVLPQGADRQWMLDNTKPCPLCKTIIEKNNGCQHMTCERCAYEFCWECLNRWHGHRQQCGPVVVVLSEEEPREEIRTKSTLVLPVVLAGAVVDGTYKFYQRNKERVDQKAASYKQKMQHYAQKTKTALSSIKTKVWNTLLFR